MPLKPAIFKYKKISIFLSTGILIAFKLLYMSFLCNKYIKKNIPSGKPTNSRRISNYALFVTSIFGHFIEQIIGRKLTKDELENLCLAGAISPIYDGFFDDPAMNELILLQLTFTPILVSIDYPMLKFYRHVLINLQQKISDPVLFHNACYNVFKAQLESKKQINNPDLYTIARISDEKGGTSFLFYASTLNSTLTICQNQLIYDFGTYVQLLDDIFDVAIDVEKGINTRITNQLNSIEKIQELLKSYLMEHIGKIEQSELSTGSKRKLINLYIFLATIGFSYLDHLHQAHSRVSLFSSNGKMRDDCKWKGWNIKRIFQLFRYMISKPAFR